MSNVENDWEWDREEEINFKFHLNSIACIYFLYIISSTILRTSAYILVKTKTRHKWILNLVIFTSFFKNIFQFFVLWIRRFMTFVIHLERYCLYEHYILKLLKLNTSISLINCWNLRDIPALFNRSRVKANYSWKK